MTIELIIAIFALLVALASFRRMNGGILTRIEIKHQIQKGRIEISDYDPKRLNPNSYNISVGDQVTVYRNITRIDLHDKESFSETETYQIPETGFVLRPGTVYLIPTKERIGSDHYEFIITGRSSFGRLGCSVHQEAGFGDIGFHGNLTMQLMATYPTVIYPGDTIAQIYFLTPHGLIDKLYDGRYQESKGAVPSRFRDEI
ncbi:MAG: dCTP deaminase [Muribaculaceae bacterium]|nr:dCTP deaminase [Muribaculaceae bacterium]